MIRGENGTPKMSKGWIFCRDFIGPFYYSLVDSPFALAPPTTLLLLFYQNTSGGKRKKYFVLTFFESLSLGELVNEPERREESPRTWSEQKMERNPKIRPNSSSLIRMCGREKNFFPSLPPPFCDLVNRELRYTKRRGGEEGFDFDGRRKGRRKEQNKLTQEERDQAFARNGSSSTWK